MAKAGHWGILWEGRNDCVKKREGMSQKTYKAWFFAPACYGSEIKRRKTAATSFGDVAATFDFRR